MTTQHEFLRVGAADQMSELTSQEARELARALASYRRALSDQPELPSDQLGMLLDQLRTLSNQPKMTSLRFPERRLESADDLTFDTSSQLARARMRQRHANMLMVSQREAARLAILSEASKALRAEIIAAVQERLEARETWGPDFPTDPPVAEHQHSRAEAPPENQDRKAAKSRLAKKPRIPRSSKKSRSLPSILASSSMRSLKPTT